MVERTSVGWRSEMAEDALRPIDPTPDEVQYLEDRIYEFNSSATGMADGELLAFFVREHDRIVAGICGNTWGGTCEVRQFWVEPSQRGRGLGTQLFEAAEQEARRRGCTQMVLMTFSFQAPSFYERRGFEVLATVDDHPRGHRTLLLRKRLAQISWGRRSGADGAGVVDPDRKARRENVPRVAKTACVARQCG